MRKNKKKVVIGSASSCRTLLFFLHAVFCAAPQLLECLEEAKYNKFINYSKFKIDYHIIIYSQAFSHFTFERSGHQLIVVDIQGEIFRYINNFD